MAARQRGPSYCVFDSPIGPCAVAWSGHGVIRFLLPEATAAATEERMRAVLPEATSATPRGWVAVLVTRVRKHLSGQPDDFADVPLDTEALPPFFAQVYEALRRVPAGATTTYGALGRKISGTTGAARAVGVAMAKNPFALLVPCHRVVGSDGKLHGFSAHGGLTTKAKLLAIEGRPEPEQKSLFGEGVVPPEETRSRAKELAKVKRSA
ncbi:MAG: methylated-DNA--[protein]-cysteine S-methyltransferase [Polyangiaceae bacterium]